MCVIGFKNIWVICLVLKALFQIGKQTHTHTSSGTFLAIDEIVFRCKLYLMVFAILFLMQIRLQLNFLSLNNKMYFISIKLNIEKYLR